LNVELQTLIRTFWPSKLLWRLLWRFNLHS